MHAATETTKTTDDLRREYAQIRTERCYDGCSPVEFNDLVAALLADKGITAPGPRDFIAAAKLVKVPCRRCGCTGQFVTGSVNGRLVGPGGECFRCEGKGWQSHKDAKRNAYYDAHRAVECM